MKTYEALEMNFDNELKNAYLQYRSSTYKYVVFKFVKKGNAKTYLI